MVNSQNNLTNEQAEFLETHGWLAIQPPEFRQRVLAQARSRDLAEGQSLYTLDAAPGGLYGVMAGYVDVIISPLSLAPQLVHVAGPGWWTGDAALITQTPRRAGVTARTRCQVVSIPESAVRNMCDKYPEDWRRIGELTVSMFDHALSALSASYATAPADRVKHTLLRLIGHSLLYGKGFEADPVAVPANQSEIGEIARLSRNAAGTALRQIASTGAIELKYGTIVVKDRTRLLEFNQDTHF